MSSIYISFNPSGFADNAVDLLKKAKHTVTYFDKDHGIPREVLLENIKGKDAVLTLLTDKIDAEFFQTAGSQLQIVANYAVGFDNVDLAAAKAANAIVTNTPCDAVNDSVAEHAFAFMIGLANRLCEANDYAKQEKYRGWTPSLLLGSLLTGKTLGIVGAGRIGSALAQRAVNGFGMKVVYSDARQNPDMEKRSPVWRSIDRRADFCFAA